MIELLYSYILGLLSILSPCSFIIVPVMTADLTANIRKILSFLGGITVTFGIMGILSAVTGKLLTNFMGPWLYLFAGAITMIAGLRMSGMIDLYIPGIFTHVKTRNSFLMGLMYGGVSLSCVGPLMASVLVYITAKASITYGFAMMYSFALGFITPFIIFGMIVTDYSIASKIMKHSARVQKAGGILLLCVSAYLLFVAVRGIL